MLNTKVNLNLKKQLLAVFMVFSMVFCLSFTTFAGGSNPLNFVDANLCTINGTINGTINDQSPTIGDSIVSNTHVSSGPQHIELVFDKNVISDAVYNGQTVYAHNQGCIKITDLTTKTDLPISVYRVGDGSNTDLEKQHLFFDETLISGDNYEITIDSSLIANNGLTLTGGTKTIDFTVQSASDNNSVVNVASVSLSKDSDTLTVGGTDTLTATVAPSNATNQNVTWASSNNNVATVDKGTITAVSAGTATITATTADGNNTTSCAVTVNNPVVNNIPAAPNVTNDDTANTVTGIAAGMEYSLDGAGYVEYDAATFNAIDFSRSHTLLVRVAAIGNNPAGLDTTLTFTANSTANSGSTTTGGNGGGNGNSTDPNAGNKPLDYVEACLATVTGSSSTDGDLIEKSKNVPLKPTIKIEFDKNIAHDTIWDNNKACFTLKDSSGKIVAINVFRISGDPSSPEKRNVYITPENDLTKGESYKIIISPKLKAFNGHYLGETTDNQEVVITFSTTTDATSTATGTTTGATPSVVVPVVTKTDINSNVVAIVDSSKIKDNVVNEIQIKEPKPESRIQAQIPIDAVKKGLAGFGINTDSVKLNIPAGVIDASSLSNGTILRISKNLMPTVNATTLLANVPQGTKNIGKVFTFSMAVCDSNNNVIKDIHNFASGKSVTATINLSSDDIKGMDTSKISAFYFDTTSKSWVDMGGSFDEKSMTYTFITTHFTDFTIMQSNVKRLAGLDRIETSIAIAKEQFKDKAPDAVVLTTANGFPDALSGEGLAYKYNAPMLLVNKSANDSKNVLNYITSTLGKGKNIYILGGTGVVSTDISDYLTSQGYNIIRIGGNNRYETNQKVVENLNVTTGTSIVLASGNDFADALSVSSIAALKGYPVLLSDKDNLSANVIKDITNIQPTNVYIIGGTGALSADIEAQIKNINGKINIVRLGGKDRYETSIKIVDYFSLDTDTITTASGQDFPDALSGSLLAAKKKSGILLIDNTDITRQKALLSKHSIKSVIVLGGEGVISSDTANSLIQK
jgi:putative cell wall-binding protein